VLRKALRD